MAQLYLRLMDPRGLRVNQNAYFSLLSHTKQLLFVIFFGKLQEVELDFRHTEDGNTDGRTDGWTDRCGSQNSYLDITSVCPLGALHRSQVL